MALPRISEKLSLSRGRANTAPGPAPSRLRDSKSWQAPGAGVAAGSVEREQAVTGQRSVRDLARLYRGDSTSETAASIEERRRKDYAELIASRRTASGDGKGAIRHGGADYDYNSELVSLSRARCVSEEAPTWAMGRSTASGSREKPLSDAELEDMKRAGRVAAGIRSASGDMSDPTARSGQSLLPSELRELQQAGIVQNRVRRAASMPDPPATRVPATHANRHTTRPPAGIARQVDARAEPNAAPPAAMESGSSYNGAGGPSSANRDRPADNSSSCSSIALSVAVAAARSPSTSVVRGTAPGTTAEGAPGKDSEWVLLQDDFDESDSSSAGAGKSALASTSAGAGMLHHQDSAGRLQAFWRGQQIRKSYDGKMRPRDGKVVVLKLRNERTGEMEKVRVDSSGEMWTLLAKQGSPSASNASPNSSPKRKSAGTSGEEIVVLGSIGGEDMAADGGTGFRLRELRAGKTEAVNVHPRSGRLIRTGGRGNDGGETEGKGDGERCDDDRQPEPIFALRDNAKRSLIFVSTDGPSDTLRLLDEEETQERVAGTLKHFSDSDSDGTDEEEEELRELGSSNEGFLVPFRGCTPPPDTPTEDLLTAAMAEANESTRKLRRGLGEEAGEQADGEADEEDFKSEAEV